MLTPGNMNIGTIRSAARKMLIDFEETQSIVHNPTKGWAREYSVVENFLRPYLPNRYSVGSGLIVDLVGEESRQQDLMVYDAWGSPILRDMESEKIIFPESLFATIEVKSSMAKRDLHDMAKKSASIASMTTALPSAMTITPGLSLAPSRVPPFCAGMAFSSTLSIADLPALMRAIRIEDSTAFALVLVCVLSDKDGNAGLLVSIEESRLNVVTTIANASNRLAHIKCDSAGDALLYFYLALMTHLAASGPLVPGPDLLAYAKAAGVGWPQHHVADEEMKGGSAVIEGKSVAMDRIEELKSLIQKKGQGTVTDEELIRLYQLAAEVPGLDVLSEPEAIFTENGIQIDLPSPRDILEAIRRREAGLQAPGDALLLQQLVDFFRKSRNRNVTVFNPSTGRQFDFRM
jgi:hypothetical protein